MMMADDSLAMRMDELNILNRIGQQVCAELDLEAVARTAVGELGRILAPDVAFVHRVEGDELVLIGQEIRAGFLYEVKERQRIGDCLCGLAAKERQPVFSFNIHADARCTDNECKNAGVQSFAALPMLGSGRLLGVIGLAFAAPRDLRDRIPFLEALAGQVAIGIRNAELHEELKRRAEELERQVEARTGALSRALAKAVEADRMKTVFLASMSHEFRTPLNSIIGFAGILAQELKGPLNYDQKYQVEMIRKNSRQILRLVGDILDVARIEVGRLDVVVEPFLMGDLVREVVESQAEAAGQKKLSFGFSLEDDAGIIWSDRTRVRQILTNLLDNAVKFTEFGGIEVRCLIDGEWLLTEVRDTGIGIAEADMERIFEDFYQAESGTARPLSGAGLGLSLCRRLVSLLGGAIGARSNGLGQGSTFFFRLPITTRKQGESDR